MAHIRVVRDWSALAFFPWVESRELGAFLDIQPSVPLDLLPFWNEYRWKAGFMTTPTAKGLCFALGVAMFLIAAAIYVWG